MVPSYKEILNIQHPEESVVVEKCTDLLSEVRRLFIKNPAKYAFISSVIMNCKFRIKPELMTDVTLWQWSGDGLYPIPCYTNGVDVFGFNPYYYYNVDAHDVMYDLLNLALTIIFRVDERSQGKDKVLFDMASQYVINNYIIDSMGVPLSKDALHSFSYKDKATEEVYNILYDLYGPQDNQVPQLSISSMMSGQDSESRSNPSGDEDNDGNGSGGNEQENENEKDGEGDGNGNQNQRPNSLPRHIPNSEKVGDKPDNRSQDSRNMSVQNSLVQAFNKMQDYLESQGKNDSSHYAGMMPGDALRFILDSFESKVRWQDHLLVYLQAYNKSDYNWLVPNRRMMSQGLYLPSLHAPTLGEIDIAIDTSGSVTNEMFSQFVAEVSSIFSQYSPEAINLVQFDYGITAQDRIENVNDLLSVQFKGGGGTDPEQVLVQYSENSSGLLIVITDGYFQYDLPDPGKPVLWAIIDGDTSFKRDFGEVIIVD